MKKYLSALLLGIMCLSAIAQNEKPMLTVRMKNGDIITGLTDISSIPFRTQYGDLAFPISDVSSISLGISTTGVDKTSVQNLLDKLHNGSTTDASSAFDKLIKMEESAIPIIKNYMETSTYKKKTADYTVEMAYEILLSRSGLTKNFKTKDVLQTSGETSVEGTYDFQTLALETDYGKLSIARSKISSFTITFRDVVNSNSGSFKLFSNLHISGNMNGGWMNTGILVKAGQNITISANGSITLQSLSGNSYTPDGGVNGSPGPNDNIPSYGSLIFKIGETGQTIKAGQLYSGKAQYTGIIYLSIYETVYNAANTGMYSAKVTVD
jgi:hypothetical protein